MTDDPMQLGCSHDLPCCSSRDLLTKMCMVRSNIQISKIIQFYSHGFFSRKSDSQESFCNWKWKLRFCKEQNLNFVNQCLHQQYFFTTDCKNK
jgi:hypothetical protein